MNLTGPFMFVKRIEQKITTKEINLLSFSRNKDFAQKFLHSALHLMNRTGVLASLKSKLDLLASR